MNRLLVGAIAVVFASCPTLAQDSLTDAPGGRARRADLEQLEEWVHINQSFTKSSRAEALGVIAAHRSEATLFTDAEFYMELRRIVALADNGHSNVFIWPAHYVFGLVPLRVYWFSDGLYVVRARAAQGDLVGARIEQIEGRTIADVEHRLLSFHGGTRGFFRRYTAQALMLSPALLHAIGLSVSSTKLRLSVVARDGEQRDVTIAVDGSSSPINARPWRQLNPESIEGETDWVTVLDRAADLPLYLQDPEDAFRYIPLNDGMLAYIQLRGNADAGNVSIRAFATEVQGMLGEAFPHSIILDNRQNGGGDLTETADFGLALPSLSFTDGRVYVMTDSATFSAGIYTSFFPKAAGPERTLIVGEHVGDRARFWAEAESPMRLSECGYDISYALEYHDLAEGCHDRDKCHMTHHKPAWNLAVGTLDPDWPVETSFADYAAGVDPVLARILAAVEEEAR